jgi:uncharacterized protein
MKLWRTVSIFVLSSVLVGGARSHAAEQPDPEALKVAKELCAIVTKDSLKQMSTQLTAIAWPEIERGLRAKQTVTTAQIDSLRQEFERIQVDFLSSVMEDAPPIYARHFTAAELRELVAFYQTPIGKKSIAILPQVTGELMTLIAPKIPKLQNDVMQSFSKVLRKKGLSI